MHEEHVTSCGWGSGIDAGELADVNDMWIYSTNSSAWTDITAGMSGSVPSPRQCLMNEVGGLLYVFGGWRGACPWRMFIGWLMRCSDESSMTGTHEQLMFRKSIFS